ncbi:hypothetical protein J6590_074809 [Homalodisca vitripennis]|nr:hypothetical protein J6590_074809 [Homalodisca vitripennis]
MAALNCDIVTCHLQRREQEEVGRDNGGNLYPPPAFDVLIKKPPLERLITLGVYNKTGCMKTSLCARNIQPLLEATKLAASQCAEIHPRSQASAVGL